MAIFDTSKTTSREKKKENNHVFINFYVLGALNLSWFIFLETF